MIDTTAIIRITVAKGHGPTRKTRKSGQREADAWTTSGSGTRYLYNDPEGRLHNPTKPVYFEAVTTEVEVVDGGFACCYVTTREFVTEGGAR